MRFGDLGHDGAKFKKRLAVRKEVDWAELGRKHASKAMLRDRSSWYQRTELMWSSGRTKLW